MKLEKIELFIIALPLVRPFRTSFGTQTSREVLIVKVVNENGTTGWAECVAMSEPLYSPEYVAGCLDLMKRFLIPALKSKPTITAEEVAPVLKPFLGAPMAKAALETAILDAQLQDQKISLATYLGATKARVACGVSVGIANDLSALADEVSSYIEQGYRRIKLKIEPGWDIAAVKKIRDLYPTILLQVDANQAYTRDDGKHLAALDEFNLLLIEQPLDEHDILGHALLAKQVKTPICLDESIISLQSARDALELKATTIINVKPGRVGGYIESVKIHDLCIKNKIPVWCGGMLETGIGRAANLALAALPGFTLPGDTSASSRYFREDLTAPFVMNDGYLDVPNTTGIGITPNLDFLDSITTYREEI
ncbi:MAG: o-succinylbenzoate synthase [Actinobacteria bacterium]|jgi:O-succinylbenzoate synthase|nr:o-succinylbenzoate synthase [Actinomycetota bacterium]